MSSPFCPACGSGYTSHCSCDLEARESAAYQRGAKWRGPALGLLGVVMLLLLRFFIGWHKIAQRTSIYAEMLAAQRRAPRVDEGTYINGRRVEPGTYRVSGATIPDDLQNHEPTSHLERLPAGYQKEKK